VLIGKAIVNAYDLAISYNPELKNKVKNDNVKIISFADL
jgi:hypothetical protein